MVLVKPKSDQVKTLPSHLEQKLASFSCLQGSGWSDPHSCSDLTSFPLTFVYSGLAIPTSTPVRKHAIPAPGSEPLHLNVLFPDIPILSFHPFIALLDYLLRWAFPSHFMEMPATITLPLIPVLLVFHSIHHSLEVLSSMERRKNFPVSASSSLRSETLPCSPGTQNSACSFDRCQVCAGIAHVFLSVQRNHIWGVSEDIPEMTTFELSFEGYIGFCHVRNWMLQTQR